MARKRKKRHLNWAPILWVLLMVNLILGLNYSRMTAATKIRVVGAKASDQERVRTHLVRSLQDKPMLRVNRPAAEEQILRGSDVRKAELSQSLFGRAVLSVAYYEPVAILEGTVNTVLTEAGTLCTATEVPEGLAVLRLFEQATRPVFAYSAAWEMKGLADVCKFATSESSIKDLVITVDRNGVVCLNSGDTGRVTLGRPEQLREKFDTLSSVLAREPNLLLQKKDLVLVTPGKPVVRPLGVSR